MTATRTLNDTYDDVLARKNALRLAAAQALAGANSTVIMTTGAIVGSILAPRLDLATLPVSFYVVGTATGTYPSRSKQRGISTLVKPRWRLPTLNVGRRPPT